MGTGTIIIGAGQAGLALSRQLATAGHDHVVLERGRIGERWRSERWDSLRLLTPNALNRLPGAPAHSDPDGFLDRDGVVAYLESYATGAPVLDHTTVERVRRTPHGFHVATDRGDWHGRNVVIATGDCDLPRVPDVAAEAPPGLTQLHAAAYRRPGALPGGGVLVVGAGPSGQQIAMELRATGRPVVLAVGRHARMPRRYRGRDVFVRLCEAGLLDVRADEVKHLAAARRAPSFPLSGAGGGESLGLDRLAAMGVVVAGRLTGFTERRALFAASLDDDVRDADRRMRRVLAKIDAHIDRSGEDAPPADPLPVAELGLGPAIVGLGTGIHTIVWATGYRRAYPWLDVPVLGPDGELAHDEGVTAVPGLFALGLRFQRTRRSHFLGGVGADAIDIAGAILARERDASLRRAA